MVAHKKKEIFEVVDGEVRDIPQRENKASNLASREGQLVNLAINLAEKQLREGTASSQVIVHYLKLGTEREKTERMKLQKEVELLEAKAASIKSIAETKELYEKAIDSMKRYGRES